MTFTVAFLIFALGMVVGYRLPWPLAKLKEFYRRRTYKPVLLRPCALDSEPAVPARRDDQ